MLSELIFQVISIGLLIGFLLLTLMASERNNKTMTRVWGSAMCVAILIQLAF